MGTGVVHLAGEVDDVLERDVRVGGTVTGEDPGRTSPRAARLVVARLPCTLTQAANGRPARARVSVTRPPKQ